MTGAGSVSIAVTCGCSGGGTAAVDASRLLVSTGTAVSIASSLMRVTVSNGGCSTGSSFICGCVITSSVLIRRRFGSLVFAAGEDAAGSAVDRRFALVCTGAGGSTTVGAGGATTGTGSFSTTAVGCTVLAFVFVC